MKTLKLKTKDAFDLYLVLSAMVNTKSADIDFKDIISLQKVAISIHELIKEFSDSNEKITTQKDDLVKVANKKISEFKSKQLKDAGKDGFTEQTKGLLDKFVEETLADAQDQVDDEVSPQVKSLYEGVGNKDVEIEMDEKKLELVTTNFEKFSKDLYNNKKKMVEMYDALVEAKK